MADIGLFLSCISLFPELYPRKSIHHAHRLTYTNAFASPTDLRHPIVTALLHLHASLLLPLFHSLWLTQGTGNANFFYASTLVFGMANGGGLIDAIWAGLATAIKVQEGYEITQE